MSKQHSRISPKNLPSQRSLVLHAPEALGYLEFLDQISDPNFVRKKCIHLQSFDHRIIRHDSKKQPNSWYFLPSPPKTQKDLARASNMTLSLSSCFFTWRERDEATSSCLHLLTIKHGTNKWLGRKTTCSALFFTSTSKRIDSPGTAMSIILLVYNLNAQIYWVFSCIPNHLFLFHPVTPQTYQKTGHPPEPEGNEITRPALGACFQELRDGNTLIQSTQTRLDYVHSFNPDERCSGFHRTIRPTATHFDEAGKELQT